MKIRAAVHAALAGAALSFTLAAVPAQAELAAGVRAEIDHLVAFVGASGCEFYRNGSWYEGRKGQSHISEKLAYLLNRDMIQATTDFIDKAATQSSMSGQAYKVRCNGGAEIASAKWLNDELTRFRATAVAKGPAKLQQASTTQATAVVPNPAIKVN